VRLELTLRSSDIFFDVVIKLGLLLLRNQSRIVEEDVNKQKKIPVTPRISHGERSTRVEVGILPRSGRLMPSNFGEREFGNLCSSTCIAKAFIFASRFVPEKVFYH